MHAKARAERRATKQLRLVSTTRKAELDTLNAAGAAALAGKIRAFWGSMGWAVRVDVAQLGRAGGDAYYGIRSALLSGLPRPPSMSRTSGMAPAGSEPARRENPIT